MRPHLPRLALRTALLLCLVMALAACATSPTSPPAAVQPTNAQLAQTQPPTATSSNPAAVQPTAAEAATPRPPIATDFTPTDPTTVNLAAGKPQLVEFFAFW